MQKYEMTYTMPGEREPRKYSCKYFRRMAGAYELVRDAGAIVHRVVFRRKINKPASIMIALRDLYNKFNAPKITSIWGYGMYLRAKDETWQTFGDPIHHSFVPVDIYFESHRYQFTHISRMEYPDQSVPLTKFDLYLKIRDYLKNENSLFCGDCPYHLSFPQTDKTYHICDQVDQIIALTEPTIKEQIRVCPFVR